MSQSFQSISFDYGTFCRTGKSIKRYIQANVPIVNIKDIPRKHIAIGSVAAKYEPINANMPKIIANIGNIATYRSLFGTVLSRVTRIAYTAKIVARKNEDVLIHAFATLEKKS
ncbi:hypothetical protein [Methanoregula boonei]|uniref:hypothetical protein n=1 Tax=Methanoregula boonei TaxID=358766 RepID=UPI0012FBA7FE|nr:hypothetical protein [Methanoregula boonei]